jgi:hypothetical protein
MAKIAHIKVGTETVASIPLVPISSSDIPDPKAGEDGYLLTVIDGETQKIEWNNDVPSFLHYIFRDFRVTHCEESIYLIDDVLEVIINEYIITEDMEKSMKVHIEYIVETLTHLISGYDATAYPTYREKLNHIHTMFAELIPGFTPYVIPDEVLA